MEEIEAKRKEREERRKKREAELKALEEEEERLRKERERQRILRRKRMEAEEEGITLEALLKREGTLNLLEEGGNSKPSSKRNSAKVDVDSLEQRRQARKASLAAEAGVDLQELLSPKEKKEDVVEEDEFEKRRRERAEERRRAREKAQKEEEEREKAREAKRKERLGNALGNVISPRNDEVADTSGLARKYQRTQQELEAERLKVEQLKERLKQREAKITQLEAEILQRDAKISEGERLAGDLREKLLQKEHELEETRIAMETRREEREEEKAARLKREKEEEIARKKAAAEERARREEEQAALEAKKHAEQMEEMRRRRELEEMEALEGAERIRKRRELELQHKKEREERLRKEEEAFVEANKTKFEQKEGLKRIELDEEKKAKKGSKRSSKSEVKVAAADDPPPEPEDLTAPPPPAELVSEAVPKKSSKKEKKKPKKSEKVKKKEQSQTRTDSDAVYKETHRLDSDSSDEITGLGVASDDAIEDESLGRGFARSDQSLYVDWINALLADDDHLKYDLPVDSDGAEFFIECAKGIIPAKLLLTLAGIGPQEGELTIIVTDEDDKRENLEYVADYCEEAGCDTRNISIDDILKEKPSAVLALIWEIIRLPLVKEIGTKKGQLKLIGEKPGDGTKMNVDELLLNWVNYWLSDSDLKVTNFTTDFQDCDAYGALLQALAPKECPGLRKKLMKIKNLKDRAQAVVDTADELEAPSLVSPLGIVTGNRRQIWTLLVSLFCWKEQH